MPGFGPWLQCVQPWRGWCGPLSLTEPRSRSKWHPTPSGATSWGGAPDGHYSRAHARARLVVWIRHPARRGEQHHLQTRARRFFGGPVLPFSGMRGHLHIGAELRTLRPASHAMRPRVSDFYSHWPLIVTARIHAYLESVRLHFRPIEPATASCPSAGRMRPMARPLCIHPRPSGLAGRVVSGGMRPH